MILNSVNNSKDSLQSNNEINILLNEIIKPRNLEENQHENNYSKNSDKICSKAHEDLNEYYITGNYENIGEIDNFVKNDNNDKDKPYFKALINIINYTIYNSNKEKKNLLKIEEIKDDVKIYIKHMISVLIFFGMGILIILCWPVTIIYCCCNCCCCCCCKKTGCTIPCFMITCILYIISIGICIYGGIRSNTIIMGIIDTKCSILKFFDQILEGESKQSVPKWPGFNKITNILIDMKNGIKDLRNATLNDLNQKLDNIEDIKIIFKNKMEQSGNAFYSPPNSNTYINLYSSDEYNINSRGISGRYVLDLIKIFGRKANIDEEKYEPKNSILDTWHSEYKLISKNADIYLEKSLSDLTIISGNNEIDIVESLEQGIENITILKDFFNDINLDIEDILINKSDLIDKSGKKIFKIFFLILGLINFILPLWIFFICIFQGRACTNCCLMRCIFKFLIHIFWNILYLLLIITFILGILLTFVGTLGNDIVSVVSFIISEDNLGEEGENLIVDQLGEAKNYLNVCINGDGRIYDLLNINNNQNNSLNNLLKDKEQINQIKNEFKDKKNFTTYSYYVDQLKGRSNLSIIPMLIKDSYDINLPINNGQYYETQPDKYLKFDIELEIMNTLISSQRTGTNKNEQWKINSNSPNECGSGTDSIFYSSEFNPLKCYPINRDWIQITSNNGIKTEAKIISDILTFLDNANNKNENINDSEKPSFIYVLNDLKRIYNEYLDQYIVTLESFNSTLNKITGKLRQYINDDDNIFSFMNGKIIGKNLKIMLKYLKNDLGKDVKNLGTWLIVLGCILFLSILFTILLIVIINIYIYYGLRDEMREIQTNNENYRHIPINQTSSTSRENKTEITHKTKKPAYKYNKEAYKFLTDGCNIKPDFLDKRGNCQAGWRKKSKNGPKDFSKDYIPPEGWTAIGLKVASIYDGGNDAWLGTGNNKGEWYIGYHGVKSIDAIHGICVDGFRRGSGQVYKDDVNINPLTNKQFPKCGEGVYFTNDIEEAKKYTLPIDYNGNKYRIVFMCRVNPYKVRIASLGDKKEYWIVEGDKLGDLYGKKRSDEVRPYRILVLEV